MAFRFLLSAFEQLAVAVVIAATAWAAGMIVAPARRRDDEPPVPMPWAITLAIGLALISQTLLLLGMLGLLRAPVVLAIIIGIHVLAMSAWNDALMRLRARMRIGVGRSIGLAAIVATLILALPPFVLTLYPPLGFDQTMYHLPYARAFAASGGVPFLPALRYPIFPQLADVLNAAVLLFTRDVATQTTGWVAGVACVSLTYAWGRELTSSRASGWLAAAMIAGSPIALYLAASGYVEPLLALFACGALYAADRARPVGDTRAQSGDVRWLVAAGVLAGSAAGVKYLGLYFVPATALLIVRRASRRIVVRDLAIYTGAALVAMAPSYGRLIAVTGNPLFPFYPELFGASPWANDLLMGPRGTERWELAFTRLWDVTFRRHLVGDLPPFSPAFVLVVPLIVWGAWREARLRPLLLIAIGYVLLAPVHAHYLLAIAPLWSVLAGVSAATLSGARPAVLIAAAVIIASGGDAYAVYRLHQLGPPPVALEARERLLAEQRPLYPAVAWLNRTAGPVTCYTIHAEMMVDYFSGTMLGDFNGPASITRMEARIHNTGSVASALDAVGATHVLVPNEATEWIALAANDPQLARIYGDDHATIYRRK